MPESDSKTGESNSVALHRYRCYAAGCLHPAVYPDGTFGWCKLCRELAALEDPNVAKE